MAVNARKKVPIERVMSYENSPVPLSLFHEDGSMLTSAKSEFMHKLESLLPADSAQSSCNADCIIYDGHATIQALVPPPLLQSITFCDMANSFTKHLQKHASSWCHRSSQLHIVFDEYKAGSIKTQTRIKRGAVPQGNLHCVIPEMYIPKNWKAFLQQGPNKAELAK